MLFVNYASMLTLLHSLYQVAGATASARYIIPLLFSRKFQFSQNKNSSFFIYDILLSYHTKQLHNCQNCYAYVIMDFKTQQLHILFFYSSSTFFVMKLMYYYLSLTSYFAFDKMNNNKVHRFYFCDGYILRKRASSRK